MSFLSSFILVHIARLGLVSGQCCLFLVPLTLYPQSIFIMYLARVRGTWSAVLWKLTGWSEGMVCLYRDEPLQGKNKVGLPDIDLFLDKAFMNYHSTQVSVLAQLCRKSRSEEGQKTASCGLWVRLWALHLFTGLYLYSSHLKVSLRNVYFFFVISRVVKRREFLTGGKVTMLNMSMWLRVTESGKTLRWVHWDATDDVLRRCFRERKG